MTTLSTILVIDDDDDLRDVIVSAIQRDGIRIIEAEDGRRALDYILTSGLPDLILLDMNMPVMNGPAFARELQARGLWTVPVIVITAAHDAERSANDINAAGWLGKPFDVRQLVAVVDTYARPALAAPLALHVRVADSVNPRRKTDD